MDDVVSPTKEEIEAVHAIPFDEKEFKEKFQLSDFIKGKTGLYLPSYL